MWNVGEVFDGLDRFNELEMNEFGVESLIVWERSVKGFKDADSHSSCSSIAFVWEI